MAYQRVAHANPFSDGSATDGAVVVNAIEAGLEAVEIRAKQQILVAADGSGDYTTIAAGLAAVPGSGATVRIKRGTYTIASSLVVPAKTTLEGEAGSLITLSDNTAGFSPWITLASGARLIGVTIENTAGTGGGVGAATVTTADDVAVTNCLFRGSFQQGVLVLNATNVRVSNCLLDTIGMTSGGTPGDGINVYGSSCVSITGCTFKNGTQDAMYANQSSKNVTFTGNSIVGTPQGVQVRVSCENVIIDGNAFDIKGTSAFTSFGVIIQTDCTSCAVTNNTFRTTVGTATPTDAVRVDTRCHRTVVSDNTIKGTFAIGINITTTGGGGTESLGTVISGNSIYNLSSHSILIATAENGAAITGNVIQGGSSKAIYASGSRCTIAGNVVRANSGFDGITCAGSFNAVTGNHVSDVGANAGILVSGNDNTVTGNTCTNNNTYGINETGDRNIIVGNSVTGNLHGTADIASAGGSSKVDYNIGRYTQKGAA